MDKEAIKDWLKTRFKERKLPTPINIKFTKKRIIITFGYNVSMLIVDGINKDLNLLELYVDECEEYLKNVKPFI